MNILKRSNLSVVRGLVFAALLWIPMLATGAIVDNFESYAVGDDWVADGAPTNWSYTGSDYDTLGIKTDPNDSNNKVLHIQRAGSEARLYVDRTDMGETFTGSVRATVDVYINSKVSTVLRFEDTAGHNANVQFSTSDGIRTWQNTGEIQTIDQYDENQWYRVILDFEIPESNPNNSYFDVSIYTLSTGGGTLGNFVGSTDTSIPFEANTGINQFRVYTDGRVGAQDLYIDNLTIIPEPGVAGLILVGLGGLAIRKRRRG